MIQAIYFVVVVCLALNPAQSQVGFPAFAGGWPGIGGFNNYANFGNQYNTQQQQQQQDVLTCISSNPQDPSSYLRLTITDHDLLGQNQLLFGQQNNEMPKDWAINGYYKPSSLQPFSGSLQVVVTQYGRVSDGCNAVAMGPAITGSLNPFGNNMLNPFLNFGQNAGGQQYRPAGHLQNTMFVAQGGMTIYSSRIRGVSRSQLLGAGMAVCHQVSSNGQCYGAVVQCCTIAKDQIPASEVYQQGVQQQTGGALGFTGAGGFSNFNGGVPLGGSVLGGSVPFELDSGNVLSFTDPNAALPASNDGNSRQQNAAESGSSTDVGSTAGLF